MEVLYADILKTPLIFISINRQTHQWYEVQTVSTVYLTSSSTYKIYRNQFCATIESGNDNACMGPQLDFALDVDFDDLYSIYLLSVIFQ